MKGAKNKADAKRFLDWTLSPAAVGIYGKYKELVTLAGFKPSKVARDAGMPEDPGTILYPMDFKKSAAARDAILDRWQKEIGR
jgi:iron(III) transport system substrate-binding protein